MAHSADISTPLPSLFSIIAEIFRRDDNTPSLTSQVIELSKLSTADLAERGLKRGEIARFVMHDSYWA